MSPRLKKVVRFVVLGGLVVAVGIQLIPVQGVASNPPGRFSLGAPPDVEAIMRRACLDCHSNETQWPLYSRVAPSSWLTIRDVTKGRKHLNFSEWGSADEDERKLDRENCWDQIESGAMPPWFYVYPMHLGARLSDADKSTLKGWMLKDKGKEKEEGKDTAENDKEAAKPAPEGGPKEAPTTPPPEAALPPGAAADKK